MKRRISIDIPICAGLIALSVWLYCVSLDYVGKVGFFPRLILVSIIILSICAIIESFVRIRSNPEKRKLLDREDVMSMAVVAVFSVIYAVMLIHLGLLISTSLFMPLYMWYLGCRSLKVILLSFTVFFAFIYGMFILLLSVPLSVLPPFMY